MQKVEDLPVLGTNNWAVALSPDGHWLVTGKTSGRMEVWDWTARRLVASNLVLPVWWAGQLRFSRTGRYLLATSTANNFDTDLKIWAAPAWTEVSAGQAHGSAVILAPDLSPDDRLLAVGSFDPTVQVSQFPSGRPFTSLTNVAGCHWACFSPDRPLLALGLIGGAVAIWDVAHGRPFCEPLPGHRLDTWAVAFSPDGRRLLTAGRNPQDAVKVWDVATQSEMLVLPAEGQIFCNVGFSPDGNILFATSLGGVAHFWRAPSWAEIAAAETREGRR
jgi:WD40 repeat protein